MSPRAHIHFVVCFEPEGRPFGGTWAVRAVARTRQEHLGWWRTAEDALTFASVYGEPERNPRCARCKGEAGRVARQ